MRKIFILFIALALIVGCTIETITQPETKPEQSTEESQGQSVENESEAKEESEEKETIPPSTTAPTGQLKAHFINVGQGDSILIQTSSQNILIDGGPSSAGPTVVNYLKNLGVTELDLVIGTHPHEDHIGGLISVLQNVSVKEVIDPGIVHTTKTFENYLSLIDQKNITFTEGRASMTRDIGGGANMQILHPSSPSSSALNDASIVTKITFGQVSFMLTGDAESTSETQIKNRGYNLKSTILKVGHHGSNSSTSSTFLSAVNPDIAVIMVGENNQYGHPHDETLAKLADAKIKIYRTDIHGTIVITTNGQTYEVNPKEPYQYNPPKVPEESATPTEPKVEEPTQPEPEPTPAKDTYVGSVKSDKYHYPSCRYVKKILPENEIWFDSVNEAKNAGYVPCKVCKPPSN